MPTGYCVILRPCVQAELLEELSKAHGQVSGALQMHAKRMSLESYDPLLELTELKLSAWKMSKKIEVQARLES